MENLKKGWITTLIGIIAIIGLCVNIYTNGGMSVTDFIMLITAIGLLAAKDFNQTNSKL